MKNPKSSIDPDAANSPFVERRAAVREVTSRALATREEPHAPEPFHYPVAPYTEARSTIHEDLVALAQPFSDRAEEFRSLRTELLQTVFLKPRMCALAVLSQDEGDGKSYTAANLAVSFSQLGGNTLLIDGDFRSPSLDTLLNMPVRAGLAEVLAGHADEAGAITAVPGVPGLHFLPAGDCVGDPLRLLQSTRMRSLVEELVARFDHVIIDTPANTSGPDGRVLSVQAGAALIVAREGHGRIAQLRRLLDQLGRSPIALAGVVVNRR